MSDKAIQKSRKETVEDSLQHVNVNLQSALPVIFMLKENVDHMTLEDVESTLLLLTNRDAVNVVPEHIKKMVEAWLVKNNCKVWF